MHQRIRVRYTSDPRSNLIVRDVNVDAPLHADATYRRHELDYSPLPVYLSKHGLIVSTPHDFPEFHRKFCEVLSHENVRLETNPIYERMNHDRMRVVDVLHDGVFRSATYGHERRGDPHITPLIARKMMRDATFTYSAMNGPLYYVVRRLQAEHGWPVRAPEHWLHRVARMLKDLVTDPDVQLDAKMSELKHVDIDLSSGDDPHFHELATLFHGTVRYTAQITYYRGNLPRLTHRQFFELRREHIWFVNIRFIHGYTALLEHKIKQGFADRCKKTRVSPYYVLPAAKHAPIASYLSEVAENLLRTSTAQAAEGDTHVPRERKHGRIMRQPSHHAEEASDTESSCEVDIMDIAPDVDPDRA
jgi:hypothetical protein